jgi:hypothetical protein
MTPRLSILVLGTLLATSGHAFAANSASGTVNVQKTGAISPRFAAGYVVRDQRNARTTQTEILLAEVAVDPGEMQAAFDPHMIAINLDALRDRNYVLLTVRGDGHVGMNATFSKTMTQFLNDTDGDLKAEFTARTATRIEGHLFSSAPLKTLDGTIYTVDLKFAVDVPAPPSGTALPAGGGDPGKALTAFVAASQKKSWPAVKAGASPNALQMFDHSYNSPAENADSTADLLKAWIPLQKMNITGGQLRGNVAILDVEGELFPGQMGLSLVQMVKTGAVWQFDRAARAGMVR